MCVVFVRTRRVGSAPRTRDRAERNRRGTREIFPGGKHTGWQNRVRGGEVILTIFRRDATRIFARQSPNTRVAAPSAGFPGRPEGEIYARCSRFLLFTPCQSSLLLCAIARRWYPRIVRVRCRICDSPMRMRCVCVLVWLVWHVCLHTGAPVITSKYASSCRIRCRDRFAEISRFLKIAVRARHCYRFGM